MRKIELSQQANSFINAIPTKHAGQIVRKIEKLAENIDSLPHIQVIGHAPFRRLKSGEYRIIFTSYLDVLEIYLIDKRNDDQIYKKLDRK
jgi:mRNA interferase RelE/StbE